MNHVLVLVVSQVHVIALSSTAVGRNRNENSVSDKRNMFSH
jgi:hypothetical protein